MKRWGTARILAACLVLASCPLRAGAAWEQTRQTVVEPMNTAFHRTLRRSIRQRDLAAILDLYAVEDGTGLSWDWANAGALPFGFCFFNSILPLTLRRPHLPRGRLEACWLACRLG